MNKNQFWSLIDGVISKAGRTDQEVILRTTHESLMALNVDEIVGWYLYFKTYHDLAYRKVLWAAATEINNWVSDDGFIDFRYWLISQGKEVYLKAMHDPDSLADMDIKAKTAKFESFGYVAGDAYSVKKNNEDGIFEIDWAHRDKYSIYDAADKAELSKEAQEDIMADLNLPKDIASLNSSETMRRFPKLHSKYHEDAQIPNSSHGETAIGYVLKNGRYDKEHYIENTPENIASFIVTNGLEGDIIITDCMDQHILNTFGLFIDRCSDKEYLNTLLKVLIPMQTGEIEPSEIKYTDAQEQEDDF